MPTCFRFVHKIFVKWFLTASTTTTTINVFEANKWMDIVEWIRYEWNEMIREAKQAKRKKNRMYKPSPMRRLIFFKTFILLLMGENKLSFLHWHVAVLALLLLLLLLWSLFRWFFCFNFCSPIWKLDEYQKICDRLTKQYQTIWWYIVSRSLHFCSAFLLC